MKDQARRQAQKQGIIAETIALWYLRLRGFHLLARNWQAYCGEIDLILRRGNLIIFVEVKSRRNVLAASEAITTRQRLRISKAARVFIQKNIENKYSTTNFTYRFDAILIIAWHMPIYIINAWND